MIMGFVVPMLVFLTGVLFIALLCLRRLFEAHHGYYGILLTLVPVVFAWPWGLAIPGLLLLLDDAVQHVVQLGDSTFTSPIHDLYGELYRRWAWLRDLNRWLDTRLKRT